VPLFSIPRCPPRLGEAVDRTLLVDSRLLEACALLVAAPAVTTCATTLWLLSF
jgi:hypothetical protein